MNTLPTSAPLPYHLRDGVPPLGYCSWCHRKTWGEEVGKFCRMPQPAGFRCPGVFVRWPLDDETGEPLSDRSLS